MKIYDTIVIGGGQSGLSCGYYLRKAKLDYLIVDNGEKPGGAWNHTWETLHLFSPAESSSLPGWPMPKSTEHFPHRDHVIEYLCKYEEKYDLNIERPVNITDIKAEKDSFFLIGSNEYRAKSLIFATGTWSHKHIPEYEGFGDFDGISIHSGEYRSYKDFIDKKVLVVGGGNSGAQIAAELLKYTDVIWTCSDEPNFLPPEIDGKKLFDHATSIYRKKANGQDIKKDKLGDIVQVPEVKDALEKGLYQIEGKLARFDGNSAVWENGRREVVDAVIWCTGFKPALKLIEEMGGLDKGRLKTDGTKVEFCDGIWAVGYGNWTGFASATLIGVGRTAKKTVNEICEYLESPLSKTY
jgi:cation diffusion facilitator CzcD-associated flavoprotein CzcO